MTKMTNFLPLLLVLLSATKPLDAHFCPGHRSFVDWPSPFQSSFGPAFGSSFTPFFDPLPSLFQPQRTHFQRPSSLLSSLFSPSSRQTYSSFKKCSSSGSEKTCQTEWEKTPKYSIREVDDGTVVEISLPDVSKENIQLNLEQRRLSLKAIVDERKEEYLIAKEDPPEGVVEAEPKEEQGIVVVDEDEEVEQQQQQQTSSNEGATEVSQEVPSKCETKGKYLFSLELPKTIMTERVEAKFEQEKLTIHLPTIPSLRSREIQIQ